MSKVQVRDARKPGWWWADNAIIDIHAPVVGPIGVAIYSYLSRHSNQDGECFPSISHLCKTLGISEPCARKYLGKLEGAGLVGITPRRDAAGDATTHLYTLQRVRGVVNDVAHLVNDISDGGKRRCPQVVNDVAPKDYLAKQDLLKDDLSTNPHPLSSRDGRQWECEREEQTVAFAAPSERECREFAPSPVPVTERRPTAPVTVAPEGASNRRAEADPREDEWTANRDATAEAEREWNRLLPDLVLYFRSAPTGQLRRELEDGFAERRKEGVPVTSAFIVEAVRRCKERDAVKARKTGRRTPECPRYASALLPTLWEVMDEARLGVAAESEGDPQEVIQTERGPMTRGMWSLWQKAMRDQAEYQAMNAGIAARNAANRTLVGAPR